MMTTTNKTPWHLTSRLLRGLAVDAEIYQDDAIAKLVEAARCGDVDALKACELLGGK